MSIRILRVKFRDPVHIGTIEKQSWSVDKDNHVSVRQVAGGINIAADGKPTTYVPESNIVSISFEPEEKAGKK